MKKVLWIALAILLSGLLAGQVTAEEATGQPAAPSVAQGTPPAGTDQAQKGVSKAQLDIMNKREQARQRRDEMLKVRAQTIKAEEEQDKAQAGAR